MNTEQVIFGTLLAVNVISFVVVMNDKRRSLRVGGQERIPEGLLFFLAAAFGSLGVYLGMLVFRHKTRKWYFQLGIPLLMLQNLAVLYLLRDLLV